MGIFDAINNYSTQVANSKPQAWNVTTAPDFQNLGVSQTANPIPSGAWVTNASGNAGANISNGRYVLKTQTGSHQQMLTNQGGGVYITVPDYTVSDGGAAVTNHQGILGPNAAGWTNAANIQQQYLGGYKTALDAYAGPNSYYTAPVYNSMTGAINNAYGQASQSYSNLAPNIQSLVDKYAVNPTLFPDQEAQNKSLADSYARAKSQYGQIDMPANYATADGGQTGISNLNQIYGAARGQFDQYTDAGNMAIGKLKDIQSGNPDAIQNVLNNPLIQMQLNQGLKAVNQSASAQGMLRSGQTLKQLQQLGIASAGNAVQQYQQNLLNTANLGNAASGSVAALYGQQSASEMERAKQLGQIDTTGAQAIAANKLSQAQQQQQATQAQQAQELQALGLSQTNASALAKLLTDQNTAAVAENARTYENNAGASQANFMSKDAASRAYLAQLLNINNAGAAIESTRQYGLNTTAQYNSF